MVYNPRKKSIKIFKQITKIVEKGKDNVLEFHKLIDDIVSKGDYAHLEMCLYDNYNIDLSKFKNIYEVKTKTWKSILFESDANVIKGLKSIYNNNNVYQQGYEIRSNNLNNFIVTTLDYPFIEESVVISEVWNNKVQRFKYTQVATASQITVTKDTDSINLGLVDTMLYQIDISKVIWATYSVGTQSIESPHELNRVKSIQQAGTQSYIDSSLEYDTNIPITHGGDYLITVKRRGTGGWLSPELVNEKYSYKVSIRLENLLGTIKEIEYYDPGSNYLHMNTNFALATGVKRTFLEVQKNGLDQPITIIYDNLNISEERNLLERYNIAIKYLNS